MTSRSPPKARALARRSTITPEVTASMSRSHDPPQQYKQSSRKGKKAWRKNVDISDVQQGLEVVREEILSGGPIAERPSSEIFTIDTQASKVTRPKDRKPHKGLKVDEILGRRSKIPSVDSRKRPLHQIGEDLAESRKRRKEGWVSHKQLQQLKERLNDTNHLSDRQLKDDEFVAEDLWADNAPVSKTTLEGHIERLRPKVAPSTLKHAPIVMTADGKPAKAVETPAAGSSYNPDFADWDDLLKEEEQKEMELERRRIEEEANETEQTARIAAIASEEGPDDQSHGGLGLGDAESDQESTAQPGKKRPKRKTPAQVNRTKRRKEAERKSLHEARTASRKRQAQEMNDLARKGSVKGTITTLAIVPDERKDEVVAETGITTLRRKRLRNVSIPEKSLEVVLPEELQDSLRRLKPEGRLLDDRFRHLLVSGRIEARKPVVRKKKRVTFTEKWTHKDFSIPV